MLAINSAAFTAGQVAVAWSDPQPSAGTTQYIITVYCATVPDFGNNSQPVPVGQPLALTFNPAQPEPLVESNSYTLQAAAYDDDGNVLARSQSIALLAWPPPSSPAAWWWAIRKPRLRKTTSG